MLSKLSKIFGNSNERHLRPLWKIVSDINSHEPSLQVLSDRELSAQTRRFRDRLAAGETLDDLLPEAFATVREASRRVFGKRIYDVQMIGGIVIHRGAIAEMRTGEGKTLVATLPTYLNALSGKGVHVVTVNDYLAARDADTMQHLYNFLGLTIGAVVNGVDAETRKLVYAADIVYGTNNEFGFDYLRDNLATSTADLVQRPFNYAIVDEIDSILIDEARTPLIISAETPDKADLYVWIDAIAKKLTPDDYEIDERMRTVALTETGNENVERMLRDAGILVEGELYDHENTRIVHHVSQAMRANLLNQRDVAYIVRDGKVVIVDEFTGRTMDGRRWSDGLHQAVEAKEGVAIQPENQTVASVTYQNFFRMYPKIGGMTGTASTEAAEFHDIYKLDIVTIPTNLTVRRVDEDDAFYKSLSEKFEAVADEIEEVGGTTRQPILVGTASIETSEMLSGILSARGVVHKVLNARQNEAEANIVAQAGRLGAVTIATNMAGRGTDIQLGGSVEHRMREEHPDLAEGSPEYQSEAALIAAMVEQERADVLQAGGLFVIGTERHESRRVDNQLRGRSGRQGDPGRSRFYLSLEDDMLRVFAPDSMFGKAMHSTLEKGSAITSPWMTKAIEKAQERVEAKNYETRKQVVEYDDVMSEQRKVVYEMRADILVNGAADDLIKDMQERTIEEMVDNACPEGSYPEQWDVKALTGQVQELLGLEIDVTAWAAEEGIDQNAVKKRLGEALERLTEERIGKVGIERWRQFEHRALMHSIDERWLDHLATLDALRNVVQLRSYAQKKPIDEYKREAFLLFEDMIEQIRVGVSRIVANVNIRDAETRADSRD